MATSMRIIERPDYVADSTRLVHVRQNEHGNFDPPPGAMWHEPELDGEHGECWAVVLPDGYVWRTNVSGSDGYWEVSGIPPHISVSPSIDNSGNGGWHGHITLGVMEP